MTKFSSRFLCLVLLLTVIRASIAETISKQVCKGDSIPLFTNISLKGTGVTATLYINYETKRLVANWSSETKAIEKGYDGKMLLSRETIWLLEVVPTDEKTYTLIYGEARNVTKHEVNLDVYVPPTVNCKPNIQRADDILTASLEDKDCGKPTATVYWLKSPRIHYEHKDLVQLPQKNKAGTYYACIDGPALRCAEIWTLTEHCSEYTVDDDGFEHSLSTYIAIILVLAVAVTISILTMLLRSKRCKLPTQHCLIQRCKHAERNKKHTGGNSRFPDKVETSTKELIRH